MYKSLSPKGRMAGATEFAKMLTGFTVGLTHAAVGGIGVAVGGTGVAVGGRGVARAGSGVIKSVMDCRAGLTVGDEFVFAAEEAAHPNKPNAMAMNHSVENTLNRIIGCLELIEPQ
jgi:hypothetical protein